jgi:hypothetical protein
MRTVTVQNKPWFCGKDAAQALRYAKSQNAVARHVRDKNRCTYKVLCEQPGFVEPDGPPINPQTVFVNESGLYSLVMGSSLASAEELQEWNGESESSTHLDRILQLISEREQGGLKRKAADQNDHLYIMRYIGVLRGVVKIGRSHNPEGRRKNLEASQDFHVELVAVFPDKGHLESAVHKKLAAKRSTRGAGTEWFRVDVQEALDVVKEAIAEWDAANEASALNA